MRFPNLYDTPKCFKTVLESLELSSGEPSNAFLPHEAESCRELLLLLTLGFCFSFFFFASLSHAGKKDIYFQSGKRRPIVQLGKTDEKVFVSVDFNFASAATQDAMRNRSLAGPTPFRLSFFSHQTKEERATKKINTTQCATGGLRDRHPSTYVFFPHQETHANNQKKQSRITRKGTKTRFLRFLRSIRISCF